jgi:hypothetical protein
MRDAQNNVRRFGRAFREYPTFHYLYQSLDKDAAAYAASLRVLYLPQYIETRAKLAAPMVMSLDLSHGQLGRFLTRKRLSCIRIFFMRMNISSPA